MPPILRKGLRGILGAVRNNVGKYPGLDRAQDIGVKMHDLLGSLLGSKCFPSSSLRILLMIKILHYLMDPKLWELWSIPYYG